MEPDRPDRIASTILSARYRLVGPIGQGGMGVVYRAMDEQLHRPVAVKILPEVVGGDGDRLARFRNEARALAALNNPHIVTIFEVGEAETAPFIAMELVEGQTLRQRLQHGPLPLRDALDITLQVAHALSAAHDKRIVHRDIKPENVMMRGDGYVKVLDFGLASLRARVDSDRSVLTAGAFETVAAGIAGTPAYMSPEQIAGAAVDARTDVFSLGVTLFEALTGTNPFLRPERARDAGGDRPDTRAGSGRGGESAAGRSRDCAPDAPERAGGSVSVSRCAGGGPADSARQARRAGGAAPRAMRRSWLPPRWRSRRRPPLRPSSTGDRSGDTGSSSRRSRRSRGWPGTRSPPSPRPSSTRPSATCRTIPTWPAPSLRRRVSPRFTRRRPARSSK